MNLALFNWNVVGNPSLRQCSKSSRPASCLRNLTGRRAALFMIRLLVNIFPEDAPIVRPLLKVTILLDIGSQVATFDYLALDEPFQWWDRR
jgi:hypothetical protein